MTDASDLGRALAAQRPRTSITCVVCGTEKEVWLREKQQPRTCSPKCRIKLHRRENPMPAKLSRWKAQHVKCQKAVDNVKADLTAKIERLRSLLIHQDEHGFSSCRVCEWTWQSPQPERHFAGCPVASGV
jgi:NADH pyrophosphatase NudC (nudix superfamily)